MREADAPIDIVDRAGEMGRRGGAETRFRHFGRNIDSESETPAQRAGSERRREPSELDELEGDAAGSGRRMRLDVVKRMDAFVDPDRDRRVARQRRQTSQVRILEWLLQENKPCLPGRLQVTTRCLIRETAIGVGTDRQSRPQYLAHGQRRGDFDIERLDADLELEETD